MSGLRVNQILVGDAAQTLRRLPAGSVDCVITSPPYFRLRDYGVDGQIGLEPTVDEWASSLASVLSEVARVLSPSGSMWLNLADTYSRHASHGGPPKSLLLGPERVAVALIEGGWTIRNKVVWAKTNPMPASVGDRLACTWEVIYFATRDRRYWFDLDAIRVPHKTKPRRSEATPTPPKASARPEWAGPSAGSNSGLAAMKASGQVGHPAGKNPGDVWQLPTANYRDAHFATFPQRLITRPLLASCPERVCVGCDTPWKPPTARSDSRGRLASITEPTPACGCKAAWRRGIVLDPFAGAGTVAVAAQRAGRDWIGIELNTDYADLARRRIGNAAENPDTPRHPPELDERQAMAA